jgi:hypothetical protein
VLGCFSFLSGNSFALYFGVEDGLDAPRPLRLCELAAAAQQTGREHEFSNQPVNRHLASELIGPMEMAINRLQPRTVLPPIPSYDQDQRAVHDAGITATRPHDVSWLVPDVLPFEQPDSVVWPRGAMEAPTHFAPIDIEENVATDRIHAPQVRGHRSPDTVPALARPRAAQVCRPFAQAFVVRRMIGAADSYPHTGEQRP